MPPTRRTEPSGSRLRAEFPILGQSPYLNHAAIGPWPRRAAEAMQAFADENMHRGPANYAAWVRRESALRSGLSRLIGARSARDIALLKNTTEGISTVAWGLGWDAGDNIVIPRGEFPSNRLPWLAQTGRGVEVREVDIRSATDAESALLEAMDGRTRLLSVSAVQWSDGFRLDLERLGTACRAAGTLFFVDAIQLVGALPVDVDACGIDFLAADAHKWLLGPEGIALFYSSEEARQQLTLLQQGWHMFEDPWNFERDDWTPAESARRFEAGSPNSAGQAALNASLEVLLDYGMDFIAQRVLHNAGYLREGLERLPGVRVLSRSEPERRSGIVSFGCDAMPAHDLYRELRTAGIGCALREGSLRLSPHFYQDTAVLDGFLEVLERALVRR